MQRVAYDKNQRELSPSCAISLSSKLHLSVFRLIVLVLWLATVLFGFTVTILTMFLGAVDSCFQQESFDKPTPLPAQH